MPEPETNILGGEAARTEPTVEAGDRTPGERETWEWLSKLAEEAQKGKDDQYDPDDAEDDRNIYWGEQWDTDLPSFKLPIVVNMLKTYILNEVSDLTDNPLKIFVHKDPTKGERDQNVEAAMQAEWARTFADLAVMVAARDSRLCPAGWLFCGIKENRQTKQKELDIRAFNPDCVTWDPDSTSDEDWTYVLTREVVDLVQIRSDFPERGGRVKPDDAHSIKVPNASPWWQVWKRWGSGSYKGPLSAPGQATRLQGYIKAQVEKITLYIYDDEMEEVPEEKKDSEGNPVLEPNPTTGEMMPVLSITTKMKYPNGRQIVGANGVILYDDKYAFLGPFPLIPVFSEPPTHEFGVRTPAVRSVRALAQAGNKMDSLVLENGIRLNSGIVIADTTSGLKPGTFSNIPGQILLKTPGSQVEIKYPNGMPESMIKMGSFFRELMAQVLGRDRKPQAGNVSGELVETEISEAQGLTRLSARMLHVAVQKLVMQMFYRMAQYYTMPRVIAYSTGGEWTPVQWKAVEKPEDYGVHVDPASFALRSKTLVQRLTLALSKQGLLSPEYILKTLEMPDAKEEAKKGQEAKQLAVQAAQAQKQMAKKPPPKW